MLRWHGFWPPCEPARDASGWMMARYAVDADEAARDLDGLAGHRDHPLDQRPAGPARIAEDDDVAGSWSAQPPVGQPVGQEKLAVPQGGLHAQSPHPEPANAVPDRQQQDRCPRDPPESPIHPSDPRQRPLPAHRVNHWALTARSPWFGSVGTSGRGEVRGVPTSFVIKGLDCSGWVGRYGGSIDQLDQPCWAVQVA